MEWKAATARLRGILWQLKPAGQHQAELARSIEELWRWAHREEEGPGHDLKQLAELDRRLESERWPMGPHGFAVSHRHDALRIRRYLLFNRLWIGMDGQLLLAGIALERHRLAHGGYPQRLEPLVPEFLEAHPVDPWSGRLPGFRKLPGGGLKLWSIGSDRIDDGGRPGPHWDEEDRVWTIPAEPAPGP